MIDLVSTGQLLFNCFPFFLSRSIGLQLPLIQLLFSLNEISNEQEFVLTSFMEEIISDLDYVFGFSPVCLEFFELPTDSNRTS